MEWVLRSPEIHSTFSNLGNLHRDGYYMKDICNAALEKILHNILTEDKYLRPYRRSISFGQNIKKDLIPLLIHANDDTTKELLIRILVDLTIPIECLLCLDVISKNDFGRYTIFEINNLLGSTKSAFTDNRATKAVIDFLKKNVDLEQKGELSPAQCTNICNSLLLLRNIIHIPEELCVQNPGSNGSTHPLQNQILWNIFSQSIDKVLIKLMIIPDANKWAVTMVQFIALLYKDQHVVTLHKLLNLWLEASLSDSSEDNESNTSPPARGSEDSSPMFTLDATSDSSDTGDSGKSNDGPSSNNKGWNASWEINTVSENGNQPFQASSGKESDGEDKNTCTENSNDMKSKNAKGSSYSSGVHSEIRSIEIVSAINNAKKNIISENSDCGYGTQIENQESISTSSNDDDLPAKKPVHQKPHNLKQRANNKARSGATMQERKRKKIVRRGKANIINVQGLCHKTPTDDDIANILKEFTVDFLLKGYNALVDTLHNQILTNMQLEIDTSHFFWLVSYFLKFATQIELDVQHLSSVLSYDIVSYLTSEGVNLCEQFELAIKLDGNDLTPCIRKLHLVVTAMREIVQAIEVYRKFSHVCNDDQNGLANLQIEMCDTEELRSLLLLLLRQYNPQFHSKQYLQNVYSKTKYQSICAPETLLTIKDYYDTVEAHRDQQSQNVYSKTKYQSICAPETLLTIKDYYDTVEAHRDQQSQDLVVTNHILLMFLDSIIKLPQYTGKTNLIDHIRQFATSDMMNLYGLLLEDYSDNGEFVNDCVFTMMHHVGGELDSLITLFQPKILKTFTSIWKSDFEICDDWSDLIEYVINTFIKKPNTLQSTAVCRLDMECFEDNKVESKPAITAQTSTKVEDVNVDVKEESENNPIQVLPEKWTEEELSSLSWYYMQCSILSDVVGEIIKLYKEDDIIKTRASVIAELFKQNLINQEDYEKLVKGENDRNVQTVQVNTEIRDDEIKKLCEQLAEADKSEFLSWVQKVLLDTCYAKICLEQIFKETESEESLEHEIKWMNFGRSSNKNILLPVSYHSLVFNQSIPLVPWNNKQASICKDLKFLQLLHKLGFHMPVDSDKVFIRIPAFWSAIYLYEVAGKIMPIDISKLKFSIDDISGNNLSRSKRQDNVILPTDHMIDADMPEATENFYQIHNQSLATMVKYTPMPGSAFKSHAVDVDTYNWLEVVRKSQEYKIILNLDSKVTREAKIVQTDIVMNDSLVDTVFGPPMMIAGIQPSTSTVRPRAEFPNSSYIIPTITNVKQETMPSMTPVLELDYFNNCPYETASMASDIMHMSDEDEKPEDLLPSVMVVEPITDE